jgi:hypothetical protein
MLDLPYYHFGSEDSLDTDVLVSVDRIGTKEEAYARVAALRAQCPDGWNLNLIVVREGHVAETLSSNGTADGLNNSLWTTYALHEAKQRHPNPIVGPVPRHRALAWYRAVRCVLTFCTRTRWRAQIKPHLKGLHPFARKLDALATLDFVSLDSFQSLYMDDTDIWKALTFYIGQALSLADGRELYTKRDFLAAWPQLAPFILRQPLALDDKRALQAAVQDLAAFLRAQPWDEPRPGVLGLGGAYLDALQEVALGADKQAALGLGQPPS